MQCTSSTTKTVYIHLSLSFRPGNSTRLVERKLVARLRLYDLRTVWIFGTLVQLGSRWSVERIKCWRQMLA